MRILSWCKANAVLSISLLAALITACIVPPDRDYAGYYDIKTLVCLFSVLAVVGALRDMQVFAALSQRMVRTFRTVRSVCTALVIVTMFGSMLLTNDTALLTFLPLSWFVLQATGQEKHAAMLFILQNCAANLCGMITPFGNPQNLYLFSFFNIPIGTLIAIMLPPFLLSTARSCSAALPSRRKRSVYRKPSSRWSRGGPPRMACSFVWRSPWCCGPYHIRRGCLSSWRRF